MSAAARLVDTSVLLFWLVHIPVTIFIDSQAGTIVCPSPAHRPASRLMGHVLTADECRACVTLANIVRSASGRLVSTLADERQRVLHAQARGPIGALFATLDISYMGECCRPRATEDHGQPPCQNMYELGWMASHEGSAVEQDARV